ncbi:MAG TPA: SGNH/GDSL hydrolase family protein [Candidatus Saccharimonadales bacterium]|nr:SGNH/GDSL hydrolase family protein [Candidatus Saccharimonadales bacterium]
MRRSFLQRTFIALTGLFVGGALTFAPAAASAQSLTPIKYAALGDSIAAGAGLPLMMGASNEDKACARSDAAYPHLVAQYLQASLSHIACSGATVSDLYGSQTAQGLNLTPQIDAAFANGKPDVITLTIGANDLNWSQVVGQCYATTCGTSWSQDAALAVARGYLRIKLAAALFDIDQKSNFQPPKVIVTSYFAPFSTSAPACADTQGITTSEMQWVNGQEAKLDQAIKSVSDLFGNMTTYVPVNFSGHELCTAEPWIQGLHAPAAFHPTVAGQAAIAKAVEATL